MDPDGGIILIIRKINADMGSTCWENIGWIFIYFIFTSSGSAVFQEKGKLVHHDVSKAKITIFTDLVLL